MGFNFKDFADALNKASGKSNPFPYGNTAPTAVHYNPPSGMNSTFQNVFQDGNTYAFDANQPNGIGQLVDSTPQPSLIDQIQQQLATMNISPTPLADLQKQAHATVAAQYDPQISGLQAQINTTTNRAHSNQKQAQQMYGDLAKDIASQMPAITDQMKQASDATSQRYNQAKAALQQQYQNQSNQQQQTLQQLGIQAAAQDAGAQQQADQNYFQQQNQLSSNQAQDALQQIGNAAVDYQRQSSNNANLAGANASQQIGNNLEDYLAQANPQLTSLKGAEANAVQALLSQLQQADSNRVNQTNQQNFQNLMTMDQFQAQQQQNAINNQNALAQLQLKQQQLDQSANNNSSLFKGTTGLAGASNYLAEQYPNDPNHAAQLNGLIADVMKNQDVQNGRRLIGSNAYGGQYADITPEYMVQLLRQDAASKGITNDSDITNTINALYAYLGKLR